MNKLIESAKRKRELSFQHWRYRLLHWSFSVDAIRPNDSPLPKYLYTHYCPLFHVTNLLLLLFPLLFVFSKINALVINVNDRFLTCCKSLQLGFLYNKGDESDLEHDRRIVYEYLYNFFKNRRCFKKCTNFEHFLFICSHLHFKLNDIRLLEPYFEEQIVLFEARYAEKEERKRRTDEFFLRLVRIGSLVAKTIKFGLIGIVYCAGIAFFISFVPIMMRDWKIIGVAFCVITTITFTIFLGSFTLSKLEEKYNFNHVLKWPFATLKLIWRGCKNKVSIAKDNVKNLYENNCPPIEIIE